MAAEPVEETARWQSIVARIHAGEPSGLESFYEEFGRGLRLFFRHHLRTSEVDDKVHDTFLAVVTAVRAAQMKSPEKLPAFLYSIAHRQVAGCIAEAVRQRSRPPVVPAEQPDPEQQAQRRQQRRLAAEVLGRLESAEREILVRFYVREQDAAQICQELGLSETQFRLRKHRAKERLGALLRKTMGREQPGDQILLKKKAASGHYLM